MKLILSKWYKYHGDRNVNWNILPLFIYDNKVFSIDVEIGAEVYVRRECTVKESWYTDRLGKSLTLSTDPPSFSDIHLSYEQKATIFRTIFRSKE